MTATVIPFNRFLEEREKKLDPKGYAGRKIHEAIDKQVKASEPLLIGDVPLLDDGIDDDVPVMDRPLLWGEPRRGSDDWRVTPSCGNVFTDLGVPTPRGHPLTRWAREQQSDPGDEIDE